LALARVLGFHFAWCCGAAYIFQAARRGVSRQNQGPGWGWGPALRRADLSFLITVSAQNRSSTAVLSSGRFRPATKAKAGRRVFSKCYRRRRSRDPERRRRTPNPSPKGRRSSEQRVTFLGGSRLCWKPPTRTPSIQCPHPVFAFARPVALLSLQIARKPPAFSELLSRAVIFNAPATYGTASPYPSPLLEA